MKQKLLTTFMLALMLVFFGKVMRGQEVLLNGTFESWDDVNTPTSWTHVENITQESTAGLVYEGTYSAKHVGGTKDLGQTISGIVAGDDYTLTLWYKVTAGDATSARIWSYWKNGTTSLTDNAAELRGPNNSYFDNNGGVWSSYSVTVTAPATADNFYFEVRTYSGATVYWDAFSFFHVASTTPTAETPTFSPAAGIFTTPQNVTISTTTPDAIIYYTTDGSDPDDTDPVYTTPVAVSSTTTLKAIAYATGVDPSSIATAVYTLPIEVTDIEHLRGGATDGTIYKLTGEAILTFQQTYRNQKFIQDGTAGVLIDDPSGIFTTDYNVGDGITGIYGTLTNFNGMLEFVPVTDPGLPTSTGNPIIPLVVSATDFLANFNTYEGRVVEIQGLTFTDAGGTFANGLAYGMTTFNLMPVNFRTTFYNVDYIGTTIPTEPQNMIGIANETNDGQFITARDLNDFSFTPIPLGTSGIVIAILLIAGVIIVRKGKWF